MPSARAPKSRPTWGPVSVKIKSLDGVPVGVAPEYEDCRRLALESGVPYQEVYQSAMVEARRLLPGLNSALGLHAGLGAGTLGRVGRSTG